MKDKLKPCPKCNKSWLYVSDGDYYSDYESNGYRVNCSCGYAWKAISWQKTEQEAIEEWNRRVENENVKENSNNYNDSVFAFRYDLLYRQEFI